MKEKRMARSDWLPTREQDLVDLIAKWIVILADQAKQLAFGWDAAECAAVVAALTAFLTARSAYEATNSTENRVAKDETKDIAKDAMRDFANSSIRFNKKMTEADKRELGVHTADKTQTSHPAPKSQPDTDVLPSANHYEHKVRAMNHETGALTKPDDAYGVRYAWQVGGEKPATGAHLPKTQFSRRTTLIVTHTEAEKGQTAYYATCYENGKGDEGSWSPITEAVIA
jgi:hypothetical protein